MTDSELKHFKGVYELLYEELGLQSTIFDIWSDNVQIEINFNETYEAPIAASSTFQKYR